mgnify:CR=1 FL=1
MSREAFIQDIVNHLLTEVDPQVLAVMASDSRETYRAGLVDGLMGGAEFEGPASFALRHAQQCATDEISRNLHQPLSQNDFGIY